MAKKSKEANEKTSEQETFVQGEDLCNEPAPCTENVPHEKEKRFCPVCGGTGIVFVGEGQLERCWPCEGIGLVVI